MPVVWRAKALADVGRIVRYIATDNSVAAKQVGRELLLAGDSLVMFPRRGRPGRQAGTRELVVMAPLPHCLPGLRRGRGDDPAGLARCPRPPRLPLADRGNQVTPVAPHRTVRAGREMESLL